MIATSTATRHAKALRDAAVLRGTAVRNPDLAALLQVTKDHSLQSQRRRIGLHAAARKVLDLGLAGDIVEMGSHRGGGAGMVTPLLLATPARRLHLFDLWGEVPEPSEADGSFARDQYEYGVEITKGAADPMLAVQELLFDKLGVSPDRVTFNRGWVHETLPAYAGAPICFAHVDLDLYESTRTALAFLEDKLAARAVVVLDDWGPAWPGVEKAYREWARTTTRRLSLAPGRHQAVVTVG